MESESGTEEKFAFLSIFASVQRFVEILVFFLWLAATVLLFLLSEGIYRTLFEIASIALLSVGIFNAITMVGLRISKRQRFSVWRFAMRLTFAVVAVIGLALSLFVVGIKIH